VGVDPLGRPCGTVLEAAKRAGYNTGVVVTSKVTDATPGSFLAHVLDRGEEDRIAEEIVGLGKLNRSVDLLLGGMSS
jgi:alkaline phosphatase